MDDGHIGTVMAALEAALNVAMADFDFSGPTAVRRGRYEVAPNAYFIAIANPSINSVQGPPLQAYERSATIDIVARAPSNARKPDDYARTALALANQVVEAIETARGTVGNALREAGLRFFTVDSVTLDPEIDGTPLGLAVAWVIVSFRYRRPDQQAGL